MRCSSWRRRVGRGSSALLFSWWAAACAADRTIVLGELDERARSMIVGITQGERILVQLVPAESTLEFELPPSFDREGPLRISRVELLRSIEELGLEAGTIEPRDGSGVAIERLERVGEASVSIEAQETVEFARGMTDARLLAERIPYPSCPNFTLEPLEALGAAGTTSGHTLLPDGRTVFHALAGFVVVGSDGSPRFIPIPEDYLFRGGAGPSGRFWFLSASRLARLDLDGGVIEDSQPIPPEIQGGALHVVAEDPLRAYVLSDAGEIWKVEDTTWSLLLDVPDELIPFPPIRRTGFFDLGGDDFVANARAIDPLIRHVNARFSYELSESGGRGFPLIERTRDGRVFAVEDSGRTYFREGDGWTPGPPLEPSTYAVQPFGHLDLMLFASDGGAYGLMSPDFGIVCGPQQLENFIGIRDIARVADRFLLAGARLGEVAGWGYLGAH